jgi:23S rRNA (adenine2503-C2)-methyltransferase
MPDKINLLDLTLDELTQLVIDWGEPRFRALQIWRWVYNTLTSDPDEMVNLPKELRQRLRQEVYVGHLQPLATTVAEDGLSEKVLFAAADGQTLETVLMRYTNRNTVCVSSQIGCPVGCMFCATGQRGFVRNLTTGEIAAQVLYFARKLREQNAHVTNVVFMGMGEPLLNDDAVWRAIHNLNDREGLALGARRFTISTVGVVPGIERMARESMSVGLAVSLHAPDNALRDRLVPINRRYPLEQLLPAVRRYIERTGRRVSFEYALAKGVNDSDEHAQGVVRLLRGLLCHVNLIPLNPTPGCPYESSPRERVLRFQDILVKGRIQTTVRLRRGVEIEAGCGQLRGQYLDQT